MRVAERDLKRLGDALVAIRERLGLTQEDFATRAGMSLKTVQRIEGGRAKPRAVTLNLIDRIAPDAFPDWAPGRARQIMDGSAGAPATAQPDEKTSVALRRLQSMSDEELAMRIAETLELEGPAAAGRLLARITTLRNGAQQRT